MEASEREIEMTDQYDWTRFQIHCYIAAPPREVFQRWATATGLESFFIGSAEFQPEGSEPRRHDQLVATGDKYYWRFLHDFEMRGEIVEITEHPSVTFTFGEMKVKVTVQTVDTGSLVLLTQYDIPDATDSDRVTNHLNCRSCWVFYLANLKSVCEIGHDLREHDPNRSDSASVHFQPSELR
jgi:uncharacterized protein YndB with AHSA1/START domain